jgi:hypothetical protein
MPSRRRGGCARSLGRVDEPAAAAPVSSQSSGSGFVRHVRTRRAVVEVDVRRSDSFELGGKACVWAAGSNPAMSYEATPAHSQVRWTGRV